MFVAITKPKTQSIECCQNLLYVLWLHAYSMYNGDNNMAG